MRSLLPFLALASCGLPRDVEDTSERIARVHVVRVGVAGPIGAAGEQFLVTLGNQAQARVARQEHSLEPLLMKLESGELDVVVAPFAADTMWLDRVTLTPPLDGSAADDRPVAVRAAARNGESRWVMRLERLARAGHKR